MLPLVVLLLLRGDRRRNDFSGGRGWCITNTHIQTHRNRMDGSTWKAHTHTHTLLCFGGIVADLRAGLFEKRWGKGVPYANTAIMLCTDVLSCQLPPPLHLLLYTWVPLFYLSPIFMFPSEILTIRKEIKVI